MTDQPPPPPPPSTPPGFGPPPPQYAPQQPAGPDFTAVDKHNAVVVDAAGVAFEMYDIQKAPPEPRCARSGHASQQGRMLRG
ncbi:hypothetical protein [Streptomyces sp. NPDC002491]